MRLCQKHIILPTLARCTRGHALLSSHHLIFLMANLEGNPITKATSQEGKKLVLDMKWEEIYLLQNPQRLWVPWTPGVVCGARLLGAENTQIAFPSCFSLWRQRLTEGSLLSNP